MRALAYHRYGGPEVLGMAELPDPEPGPEEVLVRVRAAGVNPLDWRLRSGHLRPFLRASFPMVPGADLAGEVVTAGSAVRRFQPGDAIYAMLPPAAGGASAELARVPVDAAAGKPDNLSFEQAAAVPLAALTALQALRNLGRTAPGMRVLVNGGSGGVGHFAVQIARTLQAEVTAVASSRNQELLAELGAHHTVDYTERDFLDLGRQWDVIFDAAARRSFWECLPALSRRGVYVTTLPGGGPAFAWLATRVAGLVGYGKRASFVMVQGRGDELEELRQWIEAGRVLPRIDRTFPLEEGAAAQKESEEGHTRGKIVLTLADGTAERAGEAA